MEIIEKARLLRKQIEGLSEYLDDTEALKTPELFPTWEEDTEYKVGDRRRYNNILYKCLQDHTAQSNWNPIDAPSLWARVLIPDPEEIPDWVKPDSTNAYMTGDKVKFEGKIYRSLIDNNIWSPSEYPAGWEEVV